MKLIEVKTKSGKKLFKFEMLENEYFSLDNNFAGLCVKCGSENSQCEPDARKYKCTTCSEKSVYGIQELLLQDFINIKED